MTKTARARYTLEFKQEAVRLVEGGSPNSPSLLFRTAIKASMTLISQVLLYKLVSRCKPLLH